MLQPIENIDCTDLIDAYEKRLLKKKDAKKDSTPKVKEEPVDNPAKKSKQTHDKKIDSGKNAGKENSKDDKKPTGIDLGWVPIKCEGSEMKDKELFFKIKFKESDKSQLIPAEVANRKCHQVLTTYFNDRANYYERLNKDKRKDLGLIKDDKKATK